MKEKQNHKRQRKKEKERKHTKKIDKNKQIIEIQDYSMWIVHVWIDKNGTYLLFV